MSRYWQDPFEREGIPQILKRHPHQRKDSEHFDIDDVLNDNELYEVICALYDRGITWKWIKEVYKEIEEDRGRDLASDTASIEGRDYY
ncbi:hypothetical protein GTY77_18170 [Streptomyces sp. SID8380]|nr:hypothetical protein [Streptomyces sp. SID8380]